MRLLHALLLFPLFASPVFAAGDGGDHHGRRSPEQHFSDANTTRDGKLTQAQAAEGYKTIAKSFAKIDLNHRGYVTLDDVKAWKAAKKAARQANKQAGESPAAGGRSHRGAHRRNETSALDTGALGLSTDYIVPASGDGRRIGVDFLRTPLDRSNAS